MSFCLQPVEIRQRYLKLCRTLSWTTQSSGTTLNYCLVLALVMCFHIYSHVHQCCLIHAENLWEINAKNPYKMCILQFESFIFATIIVSEKIRINGGCDDSSYCVHKVHCMSHQLPTSLYSKQHPYTVKVQQGSTLILRRNSESA